MHIIISQENSIAKQENISSDLLYFLYNLANTNQLDGASYLSGNLYVPGTYLAYIDKLHGDYNDLIITAGKIYIPFEDAEFGRIMNLYVSSDGIGCVQNELDTITTINKDATSGSLADLLGEAFYLNTNLTSAIDLLKLRNLSTLHNHLFSGCTNITEIGIPSSAAWIGLYVCLNSNINKVVIENIDNYCRIPYIKTSVFAQGNGADLYTIQNGQEVKVTELTLSVNNTEYHAGNFFLKCKSIESVIVSDGVEKININTFRECPNLETVTLSPDVKTIDSGAFLYCGKLTSINLSNVVSIGQLTFYGTKLTSIDLSSLLSAQRDVFAGVNTLLSVVIGSGMKNLENGIFGNSIRITNADLTNANISTWNKFSLHAFPAWNGNCPYNILNFHNATTIIRSDSCFMAYGGSATAVLLLYLPLITKLEKNWSTLYSRTFPSLGVSALVYMADSGRRKINLIYLKNLSDMEVGCVNGCVCQAFVINNTTPPTYHKEYFEYYSEWLYGLDDIYVDTFGIIENSDPNKTYYTNHSNLYGSNSHYTVYNTVIAEPAIDFIYVPDSAVNTYKTTTGWDRVANKIKGISELNGGVTYPTEADWEAAGKPLALIDAYM